MASVERHLLKNMVLPDFLTLLRHGQATGEATAEQGQEESEPKMNEISI